MRLLTQTPAARLEIWPTYLAICFCLPRMSSTLYTNNAAEPHALSSLPVEASVLIFQAILCIAPQHIIISIVPLRVQHTVSALELDSIRHIIPRCGFNGSYKQAESDVIGYRLGPMATADSRAPLPHLDTVAAFLSPHNPRPVHSHPGPVADKLSGRCRDRGETGGSEINLKAGSPFLQTP